VRRGKKGQAALGGKKNAKSRKSNRNARTKENQVKERTRFFATGRYLEDRIDRKKGGNLAGRNKGGTGLTRKGNCDGQKNMDNLLTKTPKEITMSWLQKGGFMRLVHGCNDHPSSAPGGRGSNEIRRRKEKFVRQKINRGKRYDHREVRWSLGVLGGRRC